MASVRERDRGWNKIQKELKKLNGGDTKIGVQQGEKHKAASSNKADFWSKRTSPRSAISDLVTIAAANEFGTKNIPARSFMRSTFDKSLKQTEAFKGRLYDRVLAGQLNAGRALGILGEFYTAKVKATITKLRTPPNAASTIKRKKSTNPLIDTGQLRAGITHVESL